MTNPQQNLSEFKGFVRFSPTKQFGDTEPLDTSHTRELLINNITALAQSSMQVRVSTDCYTSFGDKVAITPSDVTPSLLNTFTFPLTMLPNGTLAPVSVYLRASNLNSTTATNWTIRLRRQNVPATAPATANKDIASTTCTSTACTALVFPNSYLYIPASQTGEPNLIPVRTMHGETELRSNSEVYLCCLDVYANIPTSNVSESGFVLHGLCVREIAFQNSAD